MQTRAGSNEPAFAGDTSVNGSTAGREQDPHPNPARFVGCVVTFDHAGVRKIGRVVAQQWIGRTERGRIPNYLLTVQGESGACLTIDMVESYAITK